LTNFKETKPLSEKGTAFVDNHGAVDHSLIMDSLPKYPRTHRFERLSTGRVPNVKYTDRLLDLIGSELTDSTRQGNIRLTSGGEPKIVACSTATDNAGVTARGMLIAGANMCRIQRYQGDFYEHAGFNDREML